MRILLIAPIFGDTTRIASQRPRALAEVLSERGHHVTVISAKNPAGPDAPPPPGVRVLAPVTGTPRDLSRLPPATFGQRMVIGLSVATTIPRVFILSKTGLARLLGLSDSQIEAAFERINRRRRSAANTARSAMATARWAKKTLTATLPALRREEPFDVTWATFGPYGSLWLAMYLHRQGISPRWVADLRDPMTRPGTLFPMRIFNEFQRFRVLRQADALTTVSNGVRNSLLTGWGARRRAQKTFVLPNGYLRRASRKDEDARREAGVHPQRNSKSLKITYTGALYPGRSDPAMLFQAALRASVCSAATVEIHYAGPTGAHFLNEAKRLGPSTW